VIKLEKQEVIEAYKNNLSALKGIAKELEIVKNNIERIERNFKQFKIIIEKLM